MALGVGLVRADVDQHRFATVAARQGLRERHGRGAGAGSCRPDDAAERDDGHGEKRHDATGEASCIRRVHALASGAAESDGPPLPPALRYARPPGDRHARHPPHPGPVPHHPPALPGARLVRAQAAHLPGPRGEHAPPDAGARHLQGLPRALLRERPSRAALPLRDRHRPLRARLRRHLPLHPREPLRQHGDPLREHDAGPRPRGTRHGAPEGRDARLDHGAPLQRPSPPRRAGKSSTSA